MKIRTKIYFLFLSTFSVYHFSRDLFQEYHLDNTLTYLFEMDKNWCGNYCNFITFPLESFILGASLFVLKRGQVGNLGKVISILIFIWLLIFLYDYFIFN